MAKDTIFTPKSQSEFQWGDTPIIRIDIGDNQGYYEKLSSPVIFDQYKFRK
jgi:hypothetical protein